MAVLSFRRNRVRQTAKPQTGDGRELQTVDGRGQMADGRWQTGEELDPCALCNLPSAVCGLPAAVFCRLPSHTGSWHQDAQTLAAV